MLQVPKLTIIMPVYNTAQYLPRAFDALLNQVDKSFKLLVVDDGSTDNSVEVAESYANRFPYFKIIKKKNGGPSDARNVGNSISTHHMSPFMMVMIGWIQATHPFLFMLLKVIQMSA